MNTAKTLRETPANPALPPRPDTRVRMSGEPWPVMAPAGQVDRQLYCLRYDECLDVAVRLRWTGFSCGECEIRGTCDMPEAQRRREAQAMGELALIVLGGRTCAIPDCDAVPEPEHDKCATHARARLCSREGCSAVVFGDASICRQHMPRFEGPASGP